MLGAFQVLETTEPTHWLRDRLSKYWTGPTSVGGVVPEGYGSYARIYHRAERRAPDFRREPVRWSTLAQEKGVDVYPAMLFYEVAGCDPNYRALPKEIRRPYLSLENDEFEALVRALRDFTATPDQLYVAMWTGRGILEDHKPKVQLSFRDADYVLLKGSLDSVMQFLGWIEDDLWYAQAPDLMWPEDRAWVFSSDIDSLDSCVAGSRDCIDAVLAIPELEVLQTELTDVVSW